MKSRYRIEKRVFNLSSKPNVTLSQHEKANIIDVNGIKTGISNQDLFTDLIKNFSLDDLSNAHNLRLEGVIDLSEYAVNLAAFGLDTSSYTCAIVIWHD